jgi:N-carbamoyl-L-amino-acid hydrolase
MAMRKDAGAALVGLAAALLHELPRWGGPESVWNIGKMTFEPGAANVVPAEAAMILEFRDIDPITLTRVEDEVGRTVAEIAEGSRVPIDIESIGRVEPIGMDLELCSMLQEVAERRGDHPLAMPSGAGHDAMILAPLVPTAMMFVPSIGGRSHHVSENTKDEDIVFGCGVLADAVARLCTERGRS